MNGSREVHRLCANPFARRPWKNARRSRKRSPRCVLGTITLLLVVPVVAILGYLLVKAWPVLGLSFLLENPENHMTAGGVWAPLVGTFFLVLISLAVAAPIGILAGVYLNEYARDNWATRIGQSGRDEPGGRAEHRSRPVRRRRVRAVRRHGPLDAGRLLHAGRDDPAGHHHQHARGPGLRADGVPRGLLEHGRHPLADDPHHRAAQLRSAAS